jgi:hypothetical protein
LQHQVSNNCWLHSAFVLTLNSFMPHSVLYTLYRRQSVFK